MLTLGVLTGCATVLWLVSLQLRDASIADLMWGLFFVVQALTNHLLEPTTRSLWMLVLTGIWGVRLSLYLSIRNHEQPEDRRYRAMRARHGEHFWWRSLFTVFILQMLLAWFIGMPQQLTTGDVEWGWIDGVALICWTIGLLFEVVGDWQLNQFLKQDNPTGVLNTGLWRYTRHPNYFGDALLWWGFGLFGYSATNAPWVLLSPLLMTVLLLKVSGVSLLEKDIKERRPKYKDYIEKTPAFIPWFPKR